MPIDAWIYTFKIYIFINKHKYINSHIYIDIFTNGRHPTENDPPISCSALKYIFRQN